MGNSSYLCKHCNQSIVGYPTKGINEWMNSVVMLAPNGSRMCESSYSGYEGHYEDFSMNGSVWVHQACWELNGEPEFSAYDGPSSWDPNQGFGGPDTFIIDPRIKDEETRQRLLAEGLARYEQIVRENNARRVFEWFDPNEQKYHSEECKKDPWRLRYRYLQRALRDVDDNAVHNDPDKPWQVAKDPTGWVYYDNLDEEVEGEFRGTKEEMKAHLAALWAQFVESDERKEMVALRQKRIDEARAQYLEELKVEGRYQVTTSMVSGDTVVSPSGSRRTCERVVFGVRDRFFLGDRSMNEPLQALGIKTFVSDPEYKGNHSPEWEARVEAVRAAAQESAKLADAEAKRLNEQWAAEGYPVPKL